MKSWQTRSALWGLTSLLSVGCSSKDAHQPTSQRPVVLSDQAIVVSMPDDVIVAQDSLSFLRSQHPELAELKAGNLLVGDRSNAAANPDGFLRRVKSVTLAGERLTVATAPATLTDLIADGRVTTTTAPANSGPQLGLQDVGAGFESGTSIVLANLPPTTLFGPVSQSISLPVTIANQEVTLEATATAELSLTKARATFDPRIGVTIDIRNHAIQEFETYFQGILRGELVAALQGGVSFGASWSGSAYEALTEEEQQTVLDALEKFSAGQPAFALEAGELSIPLPTWMVPLAFPPFVLPVTMKLIVRADLSCGISARANATLSGGIQTTADVKLGVNYSATGGWSKISEYGFESAPIPLSVTGAATAELSCQIKPTIELQFWEAVGPYLYFSVGDTLGAEAELECNPTTSLPFVDVEAYLIRNMSAGAGVRIVVPVIDYELASPEMPLYLQDKELGRWPLWSGPSNSLAFLCPTAHATGGTNSGGAGGVGPASGGVSSGTGNSGPTASGGRPSTGTGGSPSATMGGATGSGGRNTGGTAVNATGGATGLACGPGITGNHGDPCSAEETWRCVYSSVQGTEVSQVCRGGIWQTYHRDPANCNACCGAYSDSCAQAPTSGTGGTSSGCSYGTTGNHGDACTVAAETWRCVYSSVQATNVSQVCRVGIWQTYHLNPADCAACCGAHTAACD